MTVIGESVISCPQSKQGAGCARGLRRQFARNCERTPDSLTAAFVAFPLRPAEVAQDIVRIMRESRSIARRLICILLLVLCTSGTSAQQAALSGAVALPGVRGAISGVVRKANREPVAARSIVRLRDPRTGAAGGTRQTAESGQFEFGDVEAGAYVVELLGERGQVRAVSGVVTVTAGRVAEIELVLPGEWNALGALFLKSSTAALAAAAAGGVLGIAATGRTASPER